jgi:hypothetical protein
MSTYDPFGWSTTLAAAREAPGKNPAAPGIAVFGPWIIMRLVLGVITSIIFELTGAFALSQTDYNGYDFKTHKRARAIIAIGGFGEWTSAVPPSKDLTTSRAGGLAIGLALIIIDLMLNNVKGFGGGKGAEVATVKDNVEYKACALRTVLWPGKCPLSSEFGRRADRTW